MHAPGKGKSPEVEALLSPQRELIDGLLAGIWDEVQEWEGLPQEAWDQGTKEMEGADVRMRTYRDSKFLQMKATKIVDFEHSPREFISWVSQYQYNQYYREIYEVEDPQNVYQYQVYAFDEMVDLSHLRIASPAFFVWPRDVLITRQVRFDDSFAYIYGCSIDGPDNVLEEPYPTDSECVRMYLKFCSVAEQVSPGQLRYTYYLHVDPSGWIPSWVYNLAMSKKGLCVPRYLRVFGEMEPSQRRKMIRGVPLDASTEDEEDENEEEEEEEGEYVEEIVEYVIEEVIVEEEEEEEEEGGD